jgi:hypothetical protein
MSLYFICIITFSDKYSVTRTSVLSPAVIYLWVAVTRHLLSRSHACYCITKSVCYLWKSVWNMINPHEMYVVVALTWVIESGLNLVFWCCSLVEGRDNTGSCASLMLSSTVIWCCLSILWTEEQLVLVILRLISRPTQTHAQLGVTICMAYTCTVISSTWFGFLFASTWQQKLKVCNNVRWCNQYLLQITDKFLKICL